MFARFVRSAAAAAGTPHGPGVRAANSQPERKELRVVIAAVTMITDGPAAQGGAAACPPGTITRKAAGRRADVPPGMRRVQDPAHGWHT